jgi:hypothetical protein
MSRTHICPFVRRAELLLSHPFPKM